MGDTNEGIELILTSNSFVPDTVPVLDQVAKLLYISQQLRERAAVFKNSGELEHSHAKPDAVKVLVFCRKTASAFTDAVFRVHARRTTLLDAAYRRASKRSVNVIAAAKRLAELETRGIQSNHIDVNVVKQLEELSGYWTSLRST